MYWLRRNSASASSLDFSTLNHQVMPFLVAAPPDTSLSGCRPSVCPAVIDNVAMLKDTAHADQILSLGASAYSMSPYFIASLIRRLCQQGGEENHGLVVAPFDKYGIVSAGAALAHRDFVGLCPAFFEDGPSDFDATSKYVHDFLTEQEITPFIECFHHYTIQSQLEPESNEIVRQHFDLHHQQHQEAQEFQGQPLEMNAANGGLPPIDTAIVDEPPQNADNVLFDPASPHMITSVKAVDGQCQTSPKHSITDTIMI